jgi:hypothetical protein
MVSVDISGFSVAASKEVYRINEINATVEITEIELARYLPVARNSVSCNCN